MTYIILNNKNICNVCKTLARLKNILKKGTTTEQAAPISSSSSNKQPVIPPKQKSEPPKNFSDILRQKFKSIKTENNQKLSRIFKSNQYSGNGHWVTMNGAHVFIEN